MHVYLSRFSWRGYRRKYTWKGCSISSIYLFIYLYLSICIYLSVSIYPGLLGGRKCVSLFIFFFLSPIYLFIYLCVSIYPGLLGGGLEGNILGKSVSLLLHFYFLSIYISMSIVYLSIQVF